MKIAHKLNNLGKLYTSIPKSRVVLLNDYSYQSEDDKKLVLASLSTDIKGDIISALPRCSCGHYHNRYSKGVICELCNTEVMDVFSDYRPIAWMRSIEGVPPFMNPAFVVYMNNNLKLGANLVKWMGNRQYNPQLNPHDTIIFSELKKLPNFERSYTYLVDNFITILTTILINNKKNQATVMEVIKYVKEDLAGSNKIFTYYLPIIHKKFSVKEHTSKGKYYSPATIRVTDIALTLMKYRHETSPILRERATVNIIEGVAELAVETTNGFLGKKEGFARQQMMGMRSHFSARAVVSAICGEHNYDEAELPWSLSVVLLRPYLMNKLIRRGYTNKECNTILSSSVMAFNPIIRELFDEILSDTELNDGTEWGKRGIKILVHRNPSQNSASFMLLRVVRIKDSIFDDTLGLPMLTWPIANGDIDGDHGNIKLIEDAYMFELLKHLHPSTAPLAVSNNVNKIYGKANIPETMTTMIRNRLEHEETYVM